MCGIAGIYSNGGVSPEREVLLDMAGELRHRGPDGVGLYLDGPLGMVNTRLSIVDLEGGDQPIPNESGRYWVMQNGEIYNYPELQEELESLGHVFATRCDTEVIVHAYEEWGSDCLSRLNGEFAFAVWDRDTRSLFLARDRFGIRPLYLSEFGRDFAFASEVKALLRHPRATRALDPAALVETFTLWTTLPDRSAFMGVRELPAGHFMRVAPDADREMHRWWDVPFVPPGEARVDDARVLAEELDALLEDATRIRLRSDVPVGVYVSGGLDSSVIAAYARNHTGAAMHGFSIGFEDGAFDESAHQNKLAESLGIDLHRVSVGSDAIAAGLPRAVELAEKPMLRTAPVPLLSLSSLVRRSGFKVVLTGEGADELFAGYDIFREAAVRRFWARDPHSAMRPLLLRRVYPEMTRDHPGNVATLLHFFRSGLTDTDDPLYSHAIRFNNTARCLRFLQQEHVQGALSIHGPRARLIDSLPDAFREWDELSRAQYLEIHTFLEGCLLHTQGDRMLMGNSVEGRFPFLDHRVATFAARLPHRMRLNGLEEKHLLRKAVAKRIPAQIAARRKQAYRAPVIAPFLGDDRPDYVDDLLSQERLAGSGLFEAKTVFALVRKAQRVGADRVGQTDQMAMLGILSTMLLHERMVADPCLAPRACADRVVEGSSVERDRRGGQTRVVIHT